MYNIRKSFSGVELFSCEKDFLFILDIRRSYL